MSLQFLKHYLITLDYITLDYITLDCITKAGSFMTCDGNQNWFFYDLKVCITKTGSFMT